MTPGYELRLAGDAKGYGVFATRPFAIGEVVLIGVISRRVDRNNTHATQVGRDEWVLFGGLDSMVNHSCDPNCGARPNQAGATDLVARKPIAPDDEITYDYAMRNYTIEHFPRRCRCRSAICRGSVTGWKDLPEIRRTAYRGLVAPYLLDFDRTGELSLDRRPHHFSEATSRAVRAHGTKSTAG